MTSGGATNEGGQATVELALVLPLLVVLTLVMVQVGVVARDLLLVDHSAREAARVAAVDPDPAAPARAARRAGPLVAERLDVRVDHPPGPGRSVAVHVRYRSVTDVPLIGWALPDLTLGADVTMADEQAVSPVGATGPPAGSATG